jgi:hypothetical protein
MKIELPKLVAEHIDEFSGRGWLLPPLLQWLEHSDERFFLLTGAPGTGKSMILAWVAGFGPSPVLPSEQASLARLRSVVKGAHFCQASSRNVTPKAFADSIANQLVQTVSGYDAALADVLADRVSIVGVAQATTAESGSHLTGVSIGRLDLGALDDEISFDRAFSQPLKRLYERGYADPLLLLVDALDEAQTHSGFTLPDLLARNTDLPRQVRILATSRDEPRVLKFFRGVVPFDLKRNAAPETDDVRAYADERLAALTAPPADRAQFAERLTERADGVFLYAAMVLDDLLDSPERAADLDAYALPEGLSGIYHRFLTRELGKDEGRWFGLYERLLGLIAVAQGDGLTAAQLELLVGCDVREALRACKQYLTGDMPDGPFRPFHRSFTDFLLEPDKPYDDYRIAAKTWHDVIISHYLGIWASNRASIDAYGLNNLCTHLVATGRLDELLMLIDEPWMRARQEQGGGTFGGYQADVDLAWQAVLAGPSPSIDSLVCLKAAALLVQEQVSVYDKNELVLLVRLGRLGEASAHARLRSDPSKRFEALLSIARCLLKEQLPSAPQVADARQAANQIGDLLERVRSLWYLIAALGPYDSAAADEILGDALHCLQTMQDPEQRAQAQCRVVDALAALNRLDDAEEMAMAIDDSLQWAFALKAVAIGVAKSGDFQRAMYLAARVTEHSGVLSKSAIERIGAETLADIALAQALAKHPDAAATFAAAEHAARQIGTDKDDVWDRNDALYDLAHALIRAGELAEAIRVANSIENWQRDRSLVELVDVHATSDDFATASTLEESIADADWRPIAQGRLATAYASVGRYDEALAIHDKLRTESDRVRSLITIAAALRKYGDTRAEHLLAEATARSERLEGAERATAFAHLTRVLLDAGDIPQAADAFRRIHPDHVIGRDARRYAVALRSFATALASIADPHTDDLVRMARRSIRGLNSLWRDGEECEFAIALAEVGRVDHAWELLDANRNDLQRGTTWLRLAAQLADCGDTRADKAFERALAVTSAIPNNTVREDELVQLVGTLERTRRLAIMEQVAAMIRDARRRCAVLTRLALCRWETDPIASRKLFEDAEQTAWAEWAEYSRGEALLDVVAGLAESRQFDEAYRVVATIDSGHSRMTALARLGSSLMHAGDPRGRSLLEEGLRIATDGPDEATDDRWWEAVEQRREAARLTMEHDPGASEAWSRANDLAGTPWADWRWRVPQYRAEALVDIAAALTHDPDADATFAQARAATAAIEHENPRAQTLLKLTRAMIAANRLDLAEQVLEDLHRPQERTTGIAELVEAYRLAGQPDAALRVGRLQTSDYYRRELLRDVAATFARANRMLDALRVLDETSLDGFAESVSMAHAAWVGAPPGAVLASMTTLARVAAWVRADWRDVHEQLVR